MLPAIYLYNKFSLEAVKINDVMADIFLPVELYIIYLLPPDLLPDKLLSIGHVRS